MILGTTTRRRMAEGVGRGGVRAVVAANPGPLTLDGTRTYVVGGDPCLVIDPGPMLGFHLDAVEIEIGESEVAAVCLTHWHPDHAEGAAELVVRLGAQLAATAESAERAALDEPGLELGEGVEIEFDGGRLRTVLTPGHCPDHACFYWPETGALFTGDTILGEGTSMIAPPEGDMAAYLASLERLRGLESEVIYPGHGPVIHETERVIEEYIAHRMEREQQVIEALAAGALKPAEIRAAVYEDLDPLLHGAAEGSVLAHLNKLVAESRVAERDGSYTLLES